MSSLTYRVAPHAVGVRCTSDELVVSLNDGRVLSVPLAWFPRLAGASPEQLATFEMLGEGEGIHWPAVDEDVSVVGLLEGRASVEYRGARA
ncbi:MAG: DUF2442 domain-containing protein [Pseudomonadales bacterium]|jgi:hypothetical protein|nr:DUF2442 domain-containing protein [Pseudomonadales bacterium]MCP5337836.1 DUF2442 domain-containing protein [Pseudomonadales bacterium]